jgi:hypothetical protein
MEREKKLDACELSVFGGFFLGASVLFAQLDQRDRELCRQFSGFHASTLQPQAARSKEMSGRGGGVADVDVGALEAMFRGKRPDGAAA